MAIQGFFKQYRFLSNFAPSSFVWKRQRWKTVEHAYQAAKACGEFDAMMIRQTATPGEAKKLGNQIEIRPDWEEVKINIMYLLVFEKFYQNEGLRDSLLATSNEYLEETNYWNDTFWGVCEGEGRNFLGKILMRVRDELRDPLGEQL